MYLGFERLGKNVRGTNIEIFSSEDLQAFEDQLAETPLEDLVDSRIENNVVPRTQPDMPVFEEVKPTPIAEPAVKLPVEPPSILKDPEAKGKSLLQIVLERRSKKKMPSNAGIDCGTF